jgi:thioesterase DpgC
MSTSASMETSNQVGTVGLPDQDVATWRASVPAASGDLGLDSQKFSAYWSLADSLLERLPAKPKRTTQEADAAAAIHAAARSVRAAFLQRHAPALYAILTRDLARFVRVEDLVFAAADAWPGLVPSRRQIAAEEGLDQRDKDGREIDQGVLVSHLLGDERSGLHLCHAMLLPRADSAAPLGEFAARGRLDLGAATLERQGRAAYLTMRNPRYLNAEDQTTIDAVETAIDVATLDPHSDIAVLRGAAVDHPKYKGRNIFGSGINLTHLYRGRIPFIWFIRRELGQVNKFMRGVASPDVLPDDVHGAGTEKPWVAAVETFAIGGHCQILLTMDYVLAAQDAFMTLPARKEGIIPGLANLRLPRFTGDRIARQAIQYERRLVCDSPEGRLICDEIAPAGEMDAAVAHVVAGLTNSGAVSAVGNRRAFRVGQEPLDLFRRYCAVYAREQAYCHFSPALISNLERFWDAQNRKG